MKNSKSKVKQAAAQRRVSDQWFHNQLIAALEDATPNDLDTLLDMAKDLRDKANFVDIIRIAKLWIDEGLTRNDVSSVLHTLVDSLNADEPQEMTLGKVRAVLAVARKDAQDRQRKQYARRPRKAQKVTS